MPADHAVDRTVGGSRTWLYAHQLVLRFALRTGEIFEITFAHDAQPVGPTQGDCTRKTRTRQERGGPGIIVPFALPGPRGDNWTVTVRSWHSTDGPAGLA